jgi:hypothetical protein
MAMLVELRISTWTARKRDNETTMDVNTSKEVEGGVFLSVRMRDMSQVNY